MSDNRPIVYWDPAVDAWVYRISSIGLPLRCLAAARQEYDPLPAPDYLMAAAEAGNRWEPIVVNKLRENGWRISGTQGEVEIEIQSTPHRVIVRGHMDGRHAIDPEDGTDRILEVKSMSQRVWEKWHAHRFDDFPTYAAQLTGYMRSQGDRPAVYAVVNRDTGDLDVTRIESPPLDWDEIEHKLIMAERFAELGWLPVCQGGTPYPCSYNYLCDQREIHFAELESADEQTLLHLMQSYEEARRMEAEVKANKESIRDEIVTAMAGKEHVMASGWKASFTKASRRNLDIEALRGRLGDELDGFYKTSEYETLRVTAPKRERKP